MFRILIRFQLFQQAAQCYTTSKGIFLFNLSKYRDNPLPWSLVRKFGINQDCWPNPLCNGHGLEKSKSSAANAGPARRRADGGRAGCAIGAGDDVSQGSGPNQTEVTEFTPRPLARPPIPHAICQPATTQYSVRRRQQLQFEPRIYE